MGGRTARREAIERETEPARQTGRARDAETVADNTQARALCFTLTHLK